jgi:hypothetical protein
VLFCWISQVLFDFQVKSVLDPCDANDVNSEDDNMSLGHESDQDDDLSDTEVNASQIT